MENNPLSFMREKERIELQYDSKLKFLEREIAYLIDDQAVQLYVFLQKEIQSTHKDRQKALDAKLKKHQDNCPHHMYVCLNEDSNIDNQEYDCMCLSCGKHVKMSYEEVDSLYHEHRMIAAPKTNIDVNEGSTYPYYIFLPEFSDAKEYYLSLYENVDDIIPKAMESEMTVEDYICNQTFQHFSQAKKNKVKKLKKAKN